MLNILEWNFNQFYYQNEMQILPNKWQQQFISTQEYIERMKKETEFLPRWRPTDLKHKM